MLVGAFAFTCRAPIKAPVNASPAPVVSTIARSSLLPTTSNSTTVSPPCLVIVRVAELCPRLRNPPPGLAGMFGNCSFVRKKAVAPRAPSVATTHPHPQFNTRAAALLRLDVCVSVPDFSCELAICRISSSLATRMSSTPATARI